MRFCKDCKFYAGYFRRVFTWQECLAPENKWINKSLITGKVTVHTSTISCNCLRKDKFSCGKEVTWFQPK